MELTDDLQELIDAPDERAWWASRWTWPDTWSTASRSRRCACRPERAQREGRLLAPAERLPEPPAAGLRVQRRGGDRLVPRHPLGREPAGAHLQQWHARQQGEAGRPHPAAGGGEQAAWGAAVGAGGAQARSDVETAQALYDNQRDRLELARRVFERTSTSSPRLSSSFELTTEQGNYLSQQQAYIQRLADLVNARTELRRPRPVLIHHPPSREEPDLSTALLALAACGRSAIDEAIAEHRASVIR